jgi:hypothetical protein
MSEFNKGARVAGKLRISSNLAALSDVMLGTTPRATSTRAAAYELAKSHPSKNWSKRWLRARGNY